VSAKRLNDRVEVELPISFRLDTQAQPFEMLGRVDNLSINGMKISFPNPVHSITSKVIDFVLELPKPFKRIKGNGEIQWKRWDAEKKCTTCGLKLSPLSINHLTDLDTIINEIQDEPEKTL
jgi:hypothetical protein